MGTIYIGPSFSDSSNVNKKALVDADRHAQVDVLTSALPTGAATEQIIADNLQNYKISDVDADASPNYYGYTRKDGYWYILKETVSAGNDTYRYAKGTSGYTTNWTNRVSLTYNYFDTEF